MTDTAGIICGLLARSQLIVWLSCDSFKSVTSSACQTGTPNLAAPCWTSHRCINERMLLARVTFSGRRREIRMSQETVSKMTFESLQVDIK